MKNRERVIKKPGPSQAYQEYKERHKLNKASVPLASHELRQALFPGRFTNFINSASAESAPLQRARRLKEPDFRLRDAETLLRYLGFRTNIEKYGSELRVFLDRVIAGGNDHFEEVEADLVSAVTEVFPVLA
jgi:hypothetical protein